MAFNVWWMLSWLLFTWHIHFPLSLPETLFTVRVCLSPVELPLWILLPGPNHFIEGLASVNPLSSILQSRKRLPPASTGLGVDIVTESERQRKKVISATLFTVIHIVLDCSTIKTIFLTAWRSIYIKYDKHRFNKGEIFLFYGKFTLLGCHLCSCDIIFYKYLNKVNIKVLLNIDMT